jgi:Putative mono-oxygenase ydhR
MITAIVLYGLPDTIGLEECRTHFAKIAPDILRIPGFVRKQFICRRDSKIAGGAYMWESQEAAEAFYPDRGLRVFTRGTIVSHVSATTRPLRLQTNLPARPAL